MSKKRIQTKPKDVNYCSAHYETVEHTFHTSFEPSEDGQDYKPEESHLDLCTTHYTTVDTEFWATNGKGSEEK